MTAKLVKLALKRDPNVPVGVVSTLHVDCPCGQRVPINDTEANKCMNCGAAYDGSGWKL